MKHEDLTGKKFNNLTVTRYISSTSTGKTQWECLCACGNVCILTRKMLTGGKRKSCGCLKHSSRIKNNLTGRVFGMWTVIKLSDFKKDRRTYWTCKCSCGTVRDVNSSNLMRGGSTGCGCVNNYDPQKHPPKKKSVNRHELAGKVFTNWTAIKRSFKNKGRVWYWKCQCKCGTVRDVEGSLLVNGRSKSCGCLQIDNMNEKRCGPQPPKRSGTWAQRHVLNNYMSNSKRKNREFSLSPEQFYALMGGLCYYCGSPALSSMKEKFNMPDLWFNGVDRLDSSKGYDIGNVVSCCKVCNTAKNTLSESDFKDWVDRVHNHQHKTNLIDFFINNSSLN